MEDSRTTLHTAYCRWCTHTAVCLCACAGGASASRKRETFCRTPRSCRASRQCGHARASPFHRAARRRARSIDRRILVYPCLDWRAFYWRCCCCSAHGVHEFSDASHSWSHYRTFDYMCRTRTASGSDASACAQSTDSARSCNEMVNVDYLLFTIEVTKTGPGRNPCNARTLQSIPNISTRNLGENDEWFMNPSRRANVKYNRNSLWLSLILK